MVEKVRIVPIDEFLKRQRETKTNCDKDNFWEVFRSLSDKSTKTRKRK